MRNTPVVPKIVGKIISRRMQKRLSVVQVRNGTIWTSYDLHDSNVVYCELEYPRVGAVVRFRPSGQPKKDTMLPFAYQAEIFATIESLWRKDEAEAAAMSVLAGTKDSTVLATDAHADSTITSTEVSRG
jgi:hypothetical protein